MLGSHIWNLWNVTKEFLCHCKSVKFFRVSRIPSHYWVVLKNRYFRPWAQGLDAFTHWHLIGCTKPCASQSSFTVLRSKVEFNMLERVHQKILHTIQGFPTRCHSSSLNSMLGSSNIESLIFQCKLNFINSIINLDNNSLPKKLLIKRIQDPMAKGLIPDLQAMLDHLNLPSISTLLDNPIKPASWKRSIKKQLGVRAYTFNFLKTVRTVL